MIRLLSIDQIHASNEPVHPRQTEATCDPARVEIECAELATVWSLLRHDPLAARSTCGNWTGHRCERCGMFHFSRDRGALDALQLDATFDRDPDEPEPWEGFRRFLVALHVRGVLDLSWVQ